MLYKITKRGYPPPRQFISADTFDLAVRQWMINNFGEGCQAIPATYGEVCVTAVETTDWPGGESKTVDGKTVRYTIITLPGII